MKYFVQLLLLIGATSLVRVPAQAQIQINAFGSYVSPVSNKSTISDGLSGVGGSIRYFTSPHVALGLSAQRLAKTLSYGSFTAKTRNLYVAGQAEYFFTTSALQPYVGVEVGLIRDTYRTEFVDDVLGYNDFRERRNYYYFNFGPKAGIQYMITPLVGVNAEATYKIIVD
jgi:hypothetical protein